jgi:TatA/E family protein of Tat protein translocase
MPVAESLARAAFPESSPGFRQRRKIAFERQNMFGSIGMPELILIFIVALLVFGPRKLPELGKSLGRGLAEFKRASDDLKKTIEDEIEQGKHEAEAVKKQVAEVRSTLDPMAPAASPAPQASAPKESVPRAETPIRPV